MARNSRKIEQGFDLEKAMADLEAIVEKMEHGDLPLEEALKDFERGIQLSSACHQALKDAEQKVRMLMEKSGLEELVPFAGLREDDTELDEDDEDDEP